MTTTIPEAPVSGRFYTDEGLLTAPRQEVLEMGTPADMDRLAHLVAGGDPIKYQRTAWSITLFRQRFTRALQDKAASVTAGARALYQRAIDLPIIGRPIEVTGNILSWLFGKASSLLGYLRRIGDHLGWYTIASAAVSTETGRGILSRAWSIATAPFKWLWTKSLNLVGYALQTVGATNAALRFTEYRFRTAAKINLAIEWMAAKTEPVWHLDSLPMRTVRNVSVFTLVWRLVALLPSPIGAIARLVTLGMFAWRLLGTTYTALVLRRAAQDMADIPAAMVVDTAKATSSAAQATQAAAKATQAAAEKTVTDAQAKVEKDVTTTQAPSSAPLEGVVEPGNRAEHRVTGGGRKSGGPQGVPGGASMSGK